MSPGPVHSVVHLCLLSGSLWMPATTASAPAPYFGGMPFSVQWAPDGKSFKQMVNGRLMRVDASTGQAVPYFDSGSLSAALQRAGVKTDEAMSVANSPVLEFNPDEPQSRQQNAASATEDVATRPVSIPSVSHRTPNGLPTKSTEPSSKTC